MSDFSSPAFDGLAALRLARKQRSEESGSQRDWPAGPLSRDRDHRERAREDNETMHARLRAIRDVGVRLCIDNFGSGYSSLGYLKHWPIDMIKIDQSFVRDLTANAVDRAILRAILTLGEALGMRVIAEGVETGEQLAILRESGGKSCQGYYFGHPMPAARFESRRGIGRLLRCPRLDQTVTHVSGL
ncbi:MAG: EAL domain-containing protein [Gammaproteobacteria bacterium]